MIERERRASCRRADSARGKNGRCAPNRQTSPNDAGEQQTPAAHEVVERARSPRPAARASRPRAPTHDEARNARPPAHQPTSAHAASAGTSSSIVCSTGSSARSGGTAARAGTPRARGGASPTRARRRRSAGVRRRSRRSSASPACPRDVRNEREVARALDRRRQLALVTRADAAQAARQDLAVVGDEAAERAVILVVDEADARLAERAGLWWASHGLFLVLVVVVVAAAVAQRPALPRSSAERRLRARRA